MLGLNVKEVILIEHDEDWANQYQITKKEIEDILGDNILSIHHIGSTAIKGIMAKPILDVGVEFRSGERLNVAGMKAVGYIYRKNIFVPEDHAFFKYTDEQHNIGTHHIHCYVESNSEPLKANILFCEYLNAHLETAKQYNDLKLELASVYSGDRVAYNQGKTDFINRIVSLAKNELLVK
ncbi:MAG: GrpB family protein [Oscillospiraceae bacterium]|nr:GrpB family protein [Oscillospiraceae bacterium]